MDEGVCVLPNQIRNDDLITVRGEASVKIANTNQEFETFETAEVVETFPPYEKELRAGNCSSPNKPGCDLNCNLLFHYLKI